MNIKKMVGGSIELEKQNIEIGDGPLQNKIFVFTGFRDSSLEKQIIELGGKVTSAISNKTTDLVVASEEGKSSTKLLKAKNLGIKITTKSNLIGVVKNIQKQQIKIEVEYSDVDSSSEEE
jgi:NAD-dependent DNA ligase